MKAILRIVAVLLCLLMALSILTACKKDPSADGNDTTLNSDSGNSSGDVVDSELETERRDENGYIMDDLPEITYPGVDFDVLSWKNMAQWDWCEETDSKSTVVDRALNNRILIVENRFKIKFKLKLDIAGDWANMSTFNTTVENSLMDGQTDYDLIGSYSHCAGTLASKGWMVDLNQSQYVDFSKPWWPSSIVETASIGDKVYFATGDITPTLIRNVHCMYVNDDLYESLKIGENFAGGRSMYQVVKDGDWTIELMKKMTKGTVTDSDKYGLSFGNDVSLDSFFYGAGFIMVKNTNGILEISDDLVSNHLITLHEDLKEYIVGNSNGTDSIIESGGNKAFETGRSLFVASSISDAQRYVEKSTAQNPLNFTILPMPMKNSDQFESGGYATVANFWVTMYSIPVDAPDMDMSSIILEALASEAHRSVKDVIYYDVFAARFMSNSQKAELLDMVSQSIVFDTARMYGVYIGMFADFRNSITAGESWASTYAKRNSDGALDSKISDLYTTLG